MAAVTRRNHVTLYLSDMELAELNSKVERTGLTKCAYLRQLIMDIQPKERPSQNFIEVLNELRRISISMSQIAIKANTEGIINADAYWENSRRLREAISEIKSRIL